MPLTADFGFLLGALFIPCPFADSIISLVFLSERFDLLSSLVLLSSKGIEHSMSHTAGPLHLYVQPIIDGKCCRKGIRSAVTYVAAFLVLSEVTKDGRYLHSLHAVFG